MWKSFLCFILTSFARNRASQYSVVLRLTKRKNPAEQLGPLGWFSFGGVYESDTRYKVGCTLSSS